MNKGILKNEKGVSLVLLALSIVVLFGFAAVAIDVGHLYNVKNQLQVGADAAALAGAKALAGPGYTQTAARTEAQKVAALNFADVAYDTVPAFEESQGANAGQPIPIALKPSQAEGDIVVGYWDGAGFTPAASPTTGEVNAVKVTARRTGDVQSGQPNVQNWFAKIFSLLPGNPNFSFANVSAEAIAATVPAPVLPIAVNEYWLAIKDTAFRPYSDTVHAYPSSFVRRNQVKLNPTDTDVPSAAFGYTFAVLGHLANSGSVGQDANSYINLDWRSPFHRGADPDTGVSDWFSVQDNPNGCDNCPNNFTSGEGTTPTPSPENTRWGDNFEYFFNNGYPENRLLPTAVWERRRSPESAYPKGDVDLVAPEYEWTGNIYRAENGNDPDPDSESVNCPYATVWFYSQSGGPVLAQRGDDNLTIPQVYQKGEIIITAVYDGSYHEQEGGENPLTIVGYVAIEIDGYYSSNPRNTLEPGNNSAAWETNKSRLNEGAEGPDNTMYGHAVSDILEPEPPIILGGTGPNGGDCDFTEGVRQLANEHGTVKLVEPNLHYGMHATTAP